MAKFPVPVILLGLLTCLSFSGVSGQGGNMCGLPAPDPNKTCLSIRLPWQAEPIYFCIENDKFIYRNRCRMYHNGKLSCGLNMYRNDTLIVATPWDCCPYTSLPDHCMHSHCPPAPLNRKCTTLLNLQENYGSEYGGELCCPKYFCEEGVNPESCGMKRMDPTCINPPKGKMNCVGFHDPYGCCPKFQCQGEGKPGLCPMQHKAITIYSSLNTSHMNALHPQPGAPGGAPPPAKRSLNYPSYDEDENYSQMERNYQNMNMNLSPQKMMVLPCIGDPNCPGNMKCCSQDLSVYGDGVFIKKNVNPTAGYCMEPVLMQPIGPPAS